MIKQTLVCIATAISLMACSQSAPLASTSKQIDIPRIQFEGGAMDANSNSATIYVENNCLYLKTMDNKLIYPIFSTKDALWDEKTSELIVDSTKYKLGSKLTFGGGAPNDIKALNIQNWLVQPDLSCNTSNSLIISSVFTAD